MKKLALALAVMAPLAFASSASAKDMGMRFGAGGQIDSSGNSGLSLKYWVSDLGFQGVFGLAVVGESADGANDDMTGFTMTLRVLYNIARANDTNMYAGIGASLGLIDLDYTLIDLVIGVEHYFTDYFSVAGHVGLHVDVGDQFRLDLGNTASWGTSFHFYF
jgi:hypothetical protein